MKHRIGQHKGTMVLFCAIAVSAFTMLTGVAFAAEYNTAHGELTAGTLAINSVAAINLGSHALDGKSGFLLSAVDSGNIVVQDLRGNGAGYQVQVMRDPLVGTVVDTPAYGRTLATTMSWKAPIASLNSASSDSTSTAPAPVEGPTVIGTSSASTIASAATDTGMGIYDLKFKAEDISTSFVAAAYAGTYDGTVTVSTISGP